MVSKNDLLTILKQDNIKKIFDDIWVEHLYLVWSFARNEQNKNSDLDLMYKKKKWVKKWWLSFIKNKSLLEKELNLRVDLVNEQFLNNDIKDIIEKDKLLVY